MAIELTENLHRLLEFEDEPIRVPMDWVDGVSRDEIRLSLGLHDPALRSLLHGQDDEANA